MQVCVQGGNAKRQRHPSDICAHGFRLRFCIEIQ